MSGSRRRSVLKDFHFFGNETDDVTSFIHFFLSTNQSHPHPSDEEFFLFLFVPPPS